MLIVAPFSGVMVWPHGVLASVVLLYQMLCLYPPYLPGAFATLHYEALNGAMWTISYEFRCYMIVAIIGVMGGLRCRWVILGVTVILVLLRTLLTLGLIQISSKVSPLAGMLIIDPNAFIRLLALFSVGMCYRLFADQIIFSQRTAIGCAFLLSAYLFIPGLAEFGVLTAGAYVLFSVAKAPGVLAVRSFFMVNDLSYGIYLYAWPIMSLIILNNPHISPVLLAFITLVLSAGAGYASWRLIEQPMLQIGRASEQAHRRTPSPAMVVGR
jgi:peptidoglycan/LPS O-acetylase OafA/YrhL